MDFHTFKMSVIAATGLDKDALHIYVGVGVYLLSLIVLHPLSKRQSIRSSIALVAVISIALLGEYFDNRHIILPKGVFALKSVDIKASIHDLINTCLLPFVLYILTMWTSVLQSKVSAGKGLKKRL